ncbi:MAG: DUF4417 domain-containing protein [Spirochaetota bacterium]|nr:DUF4417 domain-containing protein [Spirochaetota bacterium]
MGMEKNYLGIMREFLEEHPGVCGIQNDGMVIRHPVYTADKMSAIPFIKSCAIDTSVFEYIGFQNTRHNDTRGCQNKTVGFFTYDYKFNIVKNNPWACVHKLAQYKQVMSPDASVFYDASIEEQWINVYLNRFIGALWQKCGLLVIPTISWGDAQSFEFCFQGVETGSTVAISTIGVKKDPASASRFMAGFIEMCKQIQPVCVICYGIPFPAMYDHARILFVEHEGVTAQRRARERRLQATPFLPFEDDFRLYNSISTEGK